MPPGNRPEVQIRPAVFPTDKNTVSDLHRAYAQSLPIKLDFQGFEEELAGLPGRYDVEKGGAVFLAYTISSNNCTSNNDDPSCALRATPHLNESQHFIGVVALRAIHTKTPVPTCELKRLYLTSSSRGLGVSKLLMDAVLARARELGYKEMLLDTLGTMTTARRLYESYNFQETEKYYESVPGAVFYKLIL